MAITVLAEGTQTATVGTEHTLATITTANTVQLVVDAANLANGETLRLRIYSKVRSTTAEQLEQESIFVHAQGEKIKRSVPIPSPHSARFTLTQTGGTGRSYPWAVLSLD